LTPGATIRASAASAIDRVPVGLVLGLVVFGAVCAVVGPEYLTMFLLAVAGTLLIGTRPRWGVAMILFLLMVQYGGARTQRQGVSAGIMSLLPQGSGLLTPNNLIGVFLALLLVYHLYLDGDWSFLRSRIVQLMLAATVVLVFSAFFSGITAADQAEVGIIATSAQDPSRQLISRALFLVLFVFFIRKPNDLRMIVAEFVVLTLITAWLGANAGLGGMGRAEMGAFRAGGSDVLINSAQNPNRLAMIAVLGMVFIWEYSQAHTLRKWVRWAAMSLILLMVVTVFLSASRGGLIGLVFAGMMLFVRQRGGGGRLLYTLAVIAIAGTLIQELVPEQALERLSNIPLIGSTDPNSKALGESSIERRKYTYEIGMVIWKKSPIIGVGPGNWPYVRFMNDPLRSAAVAHNSYLAALAEGGVVTLGLYLVLFYIVVRDLLRCERDPAIVARAKREGLEWLLASTRICILAFMVFSLFADLWDLVFSYFLFGVAAVLIQRYRPADAAPARAMVPA
jgi:O-antigen ligase